MTTTVFAAASSAAIVADDLTRSPLLASFPEIRHGLTGRLSRLGGEEGNVGFSSPRDKAAAWAMRRLWCEAAGLDADRIVTLGQVHGAQILRVEQTDAGRGARPGSPHVGLGDALITDQPGVVLMTLHADCLPILLVDRRRPAVAVVHAGWRGTVADIAGATVRAMAEAFGSAPDALRAYLGPAIGRCCYEVGTDVRDAWISAGEWSGNGAALICVGERWRFDLRAANADHLRRAGLRDTNVEISEVCTRCAGDRWFSHRGQGRDTGRFGALIAIAA